MRKEYTSISFPKEIMEIIDKHVQGKGYSSRTEYIKHLIREDTKEDRGTVQI